MGHVESMEADWGSTPLLQLCEKGQMDAPAWQWLQKGCGPLAWSLLTSKVLQEKHGQVHSRR